MEDGSYTSEHPAAATSWDLNEIDGLAKEKGVSISIIDQCMYGLTIPAEGSTSKRLHAMKLTRFTTN